MSKLKKIMNETRSLSPKEKAKLALYLWNTNDPPFIDVSVDRAWRQEIRRRVREIENGKAPLIPWADVKRRIQKELHVARRLSA